MTHRLARVIETTGQPQSRTNASLLSGNHADGPANSESQVSTLVVVDQACGSCQRCVHHKTEVFLVPGDFTGQVRLEMTVRDQCFALFHSLLMPLLLALSLAFVADWLQLAEFYGIVLAICGFTLGVWLCRQLHQSALLVKKS